MELDLPSVLAQIEASGAQCRKLSSQLIAVAKAMGLIEENMGHAYGDLMRMRLKQLGRDSTDVLEWYQSKPDSPAVIRALKETAAPVLKLDIEVAPNGSGEVSVDGGPPFHLSPKLALLLRSISAGERHVPDGLPVFRSAAELKRTVPELSRSRLSQLIYRLRKKFRENGLNPYLIETDSRAGRLFVRFRLRKAAHFRLAQDSNRQAPDRPDAGGSA